MGSYMVFTTQHWGSGLGGVGRFRKNISEGGGADVGVGWVGKRGTLELGNRPDEMPIGAEKVTNGEKYGGHNADDSHRLDVLEKRVNGVVRRGK